MHTITSFLLLTKHLSGNVMILAIYQCRKCSYVFISGEGRECWALAGSPHSATDTLTVDS